MREHVLLNGEMVIDVYTRRVLMALRLISGKTDGQLIGQILDTLAGMVMEMTHTEYDTNVIELETALRKLQDALDAK